MKYSGLKILITGGAGFIGSHLVDSLAAEDARVTVYDNFSFGKTDNLGKSKNKIRIINGDILDLPKLVNACRGMDMISHHAAQLEIIRGKSDPRHDLNINLTGTLNVLKAARINKVSKVINASSACVYGQPETDEQTENHPTNPNWEYGISKLAAEKYCLLSCAQGLPVVSIRYAIVFGEREWYRRVLTIFIKRVITDKDLIIFNKGKYYRDFIYVGDIVRLHNLCITNSRSGGEVFNAGTNIATSVRDLASLVLKVSRKNGLKIINENVPEGTQSRQVRGKFRNPADLKGMRLNSGKAFRLLGWKPEVSLEEGLKKELKWAEQNLKYWSKIIYTKDEKQT